MKVEKHLIEFFYSDFDKSVNFRDIIIFLYEKGQVELAQELDRRGKLAFQDIDKELKEIKQKANNAVQNSNNSKPVKTKKLLKR